MSRNTETPTGFKESAHCNGKWSRNCSYGLYELGEKLCAHTHTHYETNTKLDHREQEALLVAQHIVTNS